MTWAKLDDRFNDHPVLLGLPRGIRLLYVEGIVWSCKQETDGVIPAGAVTRFTDEPELLEAAELLVDSGLWARTETGFEIVDFLANQRSAAEITEARARATARQQRWRRHGVGDHSLCDPRYCRNAVTDAVTNGVGNAPPTRPDPTRPELKRRDGEGRGVAPAPLGSPALARPKGFTVVMPTQGGGKR